MKIELLFYVIFIMLSTTLVGQEPLKSFNALPPTKIKKAPEFDIEDKFEIIIDEKRNLLLIKKISRNPKTHQKHLVQNYFEVPLNLLAKTSFVVDADQILAEISMKIILIDNARQILNYWNSDGEIVSILKQSKLVIGPWPYSKDLEKRLNNLAIEFGNTYGKHSTKKVNQFVISNPVYKYGSNRVTMIGEKDLDGKLNENYYYPHSISHPPHYNNNDNIKRTEEALKNTLKEQIRIKNGTLKGNPVFIYLDEEGKQESIFIGIEKGNLISDTIILDQFQDGGKNNGKEVKSKFVIIM